MGQRLHLKDIISVTKMQTENQAVSFIRNKGFVIDNNELLKSLGTNMYNKSTDTYVQVKFEGNKFKKLSYRLKSDKDYAFILIKELADSNIFIEEEHGTDWSGEHLFFTNDVIGIELQSFEAGEKIYYFYEVMTMIDFVNKVSAFRIKKED